MIHIDIDKHIIRIKIDSAEQLAEEVATVVGFAIAQSYEDLFDEEKRDNLVTNLVADIGTRILNKLDRNVQAVLEKHGDADKTHGVFS